ncbi:MAG: hypothetical protein IPM02_08275 [Betaproteobacteria bacterium]|nr:hypothetical protein [Betaproteobacteria bacterium]
MPNEPFAATASLDPLIGSSPRAARARATHRPGPKPAVRAQRGAERGELLFLIGVFALATTAAGVARSGWFTPGSDFGYWIGVAGGVGMLTLFLYPLRKRWRPARNMGTTKFWFALHMMLGIVSPLLIVLHSTLSFGSINATVAFASMVLVATSGIIGRYLYKRIHHGLYGRRATLAELQARLGLDSGRLHSKLAFAPQVEQRLAQFARGADVAVGNRGLGSPLRFVLLGFEAALVRRACAAEVKRALKERAAADAWPRQKLERRVRSRKVLIARYVGAVKQVAQFGGYERLFSWWHVLHVPLIFMLVLSAIAHVIAVHMY